MKNELLIKDSLIEELSNKITEFSIDKTEDYFVFENHLLKEFAINTKQYLISESSRFIKPDKTKSIFNLSDYEFDQYIKKSMKNLIENFNDNILDIYNGSIVKKIDSFYQIINWSKNSKVFATEYKRLFVNFKNLALTHSNQKKIKLNELDDIIMNEFVAMKLLLKEKLNEVEGDVNFTDIEKDGMLAGINVEQIKQVADKSLFPVIASGGVSGIEDIKLLKSMAHPNIKGCIVGKAIYENKINLEEVFNQGK